MTYKEEVEGLIDELINGPLKQLGISHYRIDVRIDYTDDPPCAAEARTSKNYASATIIVYASAINVGRSLREALIHELIHVAHRDLDNTLDLMMDEISDMKVLNTLDSMRVNAIEDFVDRLARTIDANLV